MRVQAPELKRYMYKRLRVGLNAKRCVEGTLEGFDQYMNISLGDTIEVPAPGTGTVAEQNNQRGPELGTVVIRGNSIVQLECLEKVA